MHLRRPTPAIAFGTGALQVVDQSGALSGKVASLNRDQRGNRDGEDQQCGVGKVEQQADGVHRLAAPRRFQKAQPGEQDEGNDRKDDDTTDGSPPDAASCHFRQKKAISHPTDGGRSSANFNLLPAKFAS